MDRPSLKFKLYDNTVIAFFFFFLAYSYALTIQIAFPLKISEIALGLIFLLILIHQKIRILGLRHPYQIALLAFILFTVLSTTVNLFWEYPYSFHEYESRFGYKFDSIMKLAYLILAYLAYIVSANALHDRPYKYLSLFLYGAAIAALYSWYLFISSLIGVPYLLLPGMDEEPQTMYVFGKTLVRCGTFKEGNYMGLFLLVSGIVAMYVKKNKFAILFFITIITTSSTTSIVGLGIFLSLHYFHAYFNTKNFHRFLVVAAVAGIVLVLLFQIEGFRFIIVDKLFSDTSKITHATFSKADRTNSTLTALNVGNANPFIGVGISNYALHYIEYLADPRFRFMNFKVIPNNIYMEILSEVGYTGLFLFLIFLYCLFRKSTIDKSRVLRNGLIAMLICFIAFPTFTLLFIWFYFGLIASLDSSKPSRSTASLETSE
ncbi:O-antigen ligase family protein [Pontibacter beigongshangensis]|uniref:O-antigen ligase family protein n=1 Tax=Pontibacter beigongshangensis TaxID=2574733 RepID=UPI00164EDAA8|nr:O-antigen ligase family protein [Pontibacter beigongshangensis]